MTRILLLGIVAVAITIIAPIGALRSISVDPDRSSSKLLTRTIFDVAEEGVKRGEEVIERREEREESGKLEERRDDAREWAER